MGRVKFVHSESGLERVIKVKPNTLMCVNGLSYYNFQNRIPLELFPSKQSEVTQIPGMSVAQFKVRCCRKHHRIILWPNGRLTLAAHQGKRARQAMKVGRAMGHKYRCAEVLEAYRRVCTGSCWGEHRKILPVELLKIAEAAYNMRHSRIRNHSSNLNDDTMEQRAQARKVKLIEAVVNEVTGQPNLWRSPMSGKVGGGHVRFHESERPWFKRVFLSGMLQSNLSMDGKKFFPTLVPEHVIRTGFGYVGGLDEKGNPYWVMLDRVGEKHLDSRTGKKPTWIVNSFYPVESGNW